MWGSITCCKDCAGRFPGCHDRCPAYQKQAAANEEAKKKHEAELGLTDQYFHDRERANRGRRPGDKKSRKEHE